MSTVSVQLVRSGRTEHYLRLRIARADRYNAIDGETLRDLIQLINDHRSHPVPLILEGDGDIFSVGADIAELANLDAPHAAAYSHLGHDAIQALESWPGVTIAHLSGYALGAGLELALGCDVLVGTPDVQLGLPGLAWALVPCMGGLRRLACRVSEEFSSELFLGGEVIDANRALAIHLIDRIGLKADDATTMARELGEFSPEAVQAIRSIRIAKHGVIDAQMGAHMFSQPFISGECQRRLRSLLAN